MRNAIGFGLLLAGCGAAVAPVGFSPGTHWSMPLVGPLEGGSLVVATQINGHGPYLFLVDPDSPMSSVDQRVITEAKLLVGHGPQRIDEAGVARQPDYALIEHWQLGDLTVDRIPAMAVPRDYYLVDNRRISGVIGRDVLTRRLWFGFDRDQGVITLASEDTGVPPAGATVVDYDSLVAGSRRAALDDSNGAHMTFASTDNDDPSHIGMRTSRETTAADAAPIPRRVAVAQINGEAFKLHLDLGEPVSQLRLELWAKARLTATESRRRLVDEVGTARLAEREAAADVTLLGATAHAAFVPFVDTRFKRSKIDGTLGLDFFRGYTVAANWPDEKLYLAPRGSAEATAVARIARWGAALPSCAHRGCVTATLSLVGDQVKLDVVRDPELGQRPIEVYLGVTPAAGHKAGDLLIELPANAAALSGAIPADYAGATLGVLDASPFVRSCAGGQGCVFDSLAP